MIKTDQKKPRLASIQSMLIVAPYKSEQETKALIKTYKNSFPTSFQLDFLIVVEQVKKDQAFFQTTHLHYVTNKDFNFFGRLKNKSLASLFSHNYDALLCSCFEFNKVVKKIVNKIKNKLSIGVDQKGMHNFDLGFVIHEQSVQRLAEQTVKYLKQL